MTDAADWTGRVGDVWASEWRRTDRSLADLSRHLDAAILAAAPTGPFRALDIGCGAGGHQSRARDGAAGCDDRRRHLSEPLVATARERFAAAANDREGAHGRAVQNVTFDVGDARNLALAHTPFDLLYSRHGVMFFGDPVAAFTTLRQAAVPGARLVFSCFRDWTLNAFAAAPIAALDLSPPAAGPGPFAFADRSWVAAVLTAAGWRDAKPIAVDFAYRAGAGTDPVGDALDLLQRIGPAAAALRTTTGDDRADRLAQLRAVIARYHSGDAVDFPAAAWLWSATA